MTAREMSTPRVEEGDCAEKDTDGIDEENCLSLAEAEGDQAVGGMVSPPLGDGTSSNPAKEGHKGGVEYGDPQHRDGNNEGGQQVGHVVGRPHNGHH